ncbi:AAA family ATPase [Burkholderia sp. F1]|uniref:AAA family ATPase n=1 Tax=Burkholderia sp. F1 TaxID=3366817 RepID=UPI003D7339E2
MGPSGAGKSTIAGRLAHEFNLAAFEFDSIYWDLSGADFVKHSEESMAAAIGEIVARDSWIVEGAYDKRMAPFLAECSLILKVDVPFWLRAVRLIRRYLRSSAEGKRPRETLWNTIHLVRFSYSFDQRLDRFLAGDSKLAAKVVSVRGASSCIGAMRAMHAR